MAKDVRQKFTLDASQATQAIKAITTSLRKYNEEVKKVATSTKEQNRELARLNPRLQKFAETMKAVNRAAQQLNRAYQTQTTRVRESARAAASAARSMGTLAGNVRSANTAMRQAAASAQMFAQRFRDASINMGKANRNLRNSAALLGQFNAELRRVIASIQQKNAGLIRQTGLHGRHNRALSQGAKEARNVVISWQSIARIVATTAVHRLALRLAQAFIRAREEAQEFSIRIGEIKTIEGEVKLATEEWNRELIRLSDSFGFTVLDAAEGAYQALSNQVVEAGNATRFMAEQMKLARTAVTTLGEAVAVTTSILNAWNIGQENAREVNSILMATVERGRLRLEELANTLGRVNILSSQLGISLLEQNAAITLLSRQGVKAEEAITLLRNVMLKLVKPTDYMKGVMRELGVQSGRAAIASFGLVGTMERLGEKAKDGADELDELGKMYGRIRAIVGATGLTMNDFRKEVDLLIQSSLDYENKASEAFGTTGRQLQQEFQRAKNVLVDWGQSLNEVMLESFKMFGGLDNTLKKLGEGVVTGARLFIEYQLAVKLVIPAIVTLTHSIRTGTGAIHAWHGAVLLAHRATMAFARALPILLVIGLMESMVRASNSIKNFASDLDYAEDRAKALSEELGREAFDKWAQSVREASLRFNAAVNETFRLYSLFVAGVRRENFALETDIKKTFEALSKSIKNALVEPLKALKDELRDLARSAETIRDDIASREKDIMKRRFEAKDDAFRSGLVDKSEEEQIVRLNNLRKMLHKQALAAMRKGETDQADMLFKKVEQLQKEVTGRVRALYDAAAKKEDIELTVRRRVRDPLTGRPRTITDKVKVGERTADPAGAAKQLAALNALERDRKMIVKERIAAEEAHIKRKEVEAKRLEAEVKARGKALSAFQALLAELDSFDTKQTDAASKFNTLITKADTAAAKAGLDPKARLEFLRKSYAQRLTLARETARRAAADELAIAEGVLDKITAKFKDAVTERESAIRDQKKLVLEQVAPAFDGLIKKIQQLETQFKYHGRFQPGVGGQALRETSVAAFDLQEALNKYKRLQTPEELQKVIAALATLKEKMKELDEVRDEIRVQRPGLGGVFGFYQAPTDFEGSLQTGRNQNLKLLGEEFDTLAKQIMEAQARVNESFAKEGNLGQRLHQIRELVSKIPPEFKKVGESSKEAAIASILASRNEHQALNWTLNRLEKIRLKHLEIAAAAARAKAAGGYSHGGKVVPARHFGMGGAQGIDRYPAFLAEGEIVMTQMASNQFAPLLHALNSTAPALRSSSGSVSFGDINITVPQGTTDVQIDTIIRGLQRRSRQGLLNL